MGILLCSCGYTYSSRKPILSQFYINKLFIGKAKNLTEYGDSDSYVTEAFIESFGGRDDLSIVDNDSNADGKIVLQVSSVSLGSSSTVQGDEKTGKAGKIPKDKVVSIVLNLTLNVRVQVISNPPHAMLVYQKDIARSRLIDVPLNEGERRDSNGIGLEGRINRTLLLLAKDISDQARNEIYDIF